MQIIPSYHRLPQQLEFDHQKSRSSSRIPEMQTAYTNPTVNPVRTELFLSDPSAGHPLHGVLLLLWMIALKSRLPEFRFPAGGFANASPALQAVPATPISMEK
jgi:hypothetical protein